MRRATSRVSRVLTSGPLAPFVEDYRRELGGPWLHGALGGERAASSSSLQCLARAARHPGRATGQQRRRGVPELPTGRWEAPLAMVTPRVVVLARRATPQAGRATRWPSTGGLSRRSAAGAFRKLPVARAGVGGRHCRRLRRPCTPVLVGAPAGGRAGFGDTGGSDGCRAPGVAHHVGERGPELRLGISVVPPLRFPGRAHRGRPFRGRPPAQGTAAVLAPAGLALAGRG
jgi:hypothetical protein